MFMAVVVEKSARLSKIFSFLIISDNTLWIQLLQHATLLDFPGSSQTARLRIHGSELSNYSASNKVALTEEHKERRLNFANQFVGMADDFWENVIFSDEKVFQSCHNGTVRVYRPRNCRYEESYLNPTVRSGRFSVNVWGWISCQGPGVCWRIEERLTGVHYASILENVMLPSISQLYPDNFTSVYLLLLFAII